MASYVRVQTIPITVYKKNKTAILPKSMNLIDAAEQPEKLHMSGKSKDM